jgi:D-alanyl-lipoteichoic acid acyltransferase DltB (MBOAT superfamily)
MLFNSINFAVFLAFVLAIVRIFGLRYRNWVLLFASFAFYALGSWFYHPPTTSSVYDFDTDRLIGALGFFGLLCFNCMVAYGCALRIAAATGDRQRRRWCAVGVCTSVAILCFFKYWGFFLDTFYAAFHALGWAPQHDPIKIILPIGISFYTFQAIAYMVDVYRGTTPPCRNLRDFLLFKTFFPQLVAGPIERANNLLPQIQQPRRITNADILEGLYLVLWGYVKKCVIADNLALKILRIKTQDSFTGGDVLLGALGFTFQAYGDFSGYTDIARGVARWFGVNLMQNFNHPYYATSPQDFWRRWHISLGSWLREYLYIPLGGNRKGAFRTWLNLIITMLVGGLWHGPSWNYVIWGAYQGLILSLHRAYVAWRGEKRHTHWSRAFAIFGNFFLTMYGMLIFLLIPHENVSSWERISAATSAIFTFSAGPEFLPRLLRMLPYIGLILLMETPVFITKNQWFFVRRRPVIVAAVFLFLFYCLLILGVTGGDQFIYFAF